jgi:hypothetical protein
MRCRPGSGRSRRGGSPVISGRWAGRSRVRIRRLVRFRRWPTPHDRPRRKLPGRRRSRPGGRGPVVVMRVRLRAEAVGRLSRTRPPKTRARRQDLRRKVRPRPASQRQTARRVLRGRVRRLPALGSRLPVSRAPHGRSHRPSVVGSLVPARVLVRWALRLGSKVSPVGRARPRRTGPSCRSCRSTVRSGRKRARAPRTAAGTAGRGAVRVRRPVGRCRWATRFRSFRPAHDGRRVAPARPSRRRPTPPTLSRRRPAPHPASRQRRAAPPTPSRRQATLRTPGQRRAAPFTHSRAAPFTHSRAAPFTHSRAAPLTHNPCQPTLRTLNQRQATPPTPSRRRAVPLTPSRSRALPLTPSRRRPTPH